MAVRLLGFVLLVALLAMVVIVVLRTRDVVDGWVARRAERQLAGPERRQDEALEQARKRLRKAEKAHARRVREARAELTEAGRDRVLAKVGPVILGPCTITMKKVVHELSGSTTFRVDVEGEIRPVLTRRGDREQTSHDDQREVYLTVTDDTWADTVRLTPAQLEGARRVEVAGAAAVRNLEAARGERDRRLLAAQEVLDQVLADTGDVELARLTLEDLEGIGPRPIDVPEPPPEEPGHEGPTDEDPPRR